MKRRIFIQATDEHAKEICKRVMLVEVDVESIGDLVEVIEYIHNKLKFDMVNNWRLQASFSSGSLDKIQYLGMTCRVENKINEPYKDTNLDTSPKWKVRFKDGAEIDAFEDELTL